MTAVEVTEEFNEQLRLMVRRRDDGLGKDFGRIRCQADRSSVLLDIAKRVDEELFDRLNVVSQTLLATFDAHGVVLNDLEKLQWTQTLHGKLNSSADHLFNELFFKKTYRLQLAGIQDGFMEDLRQDIRLKLGDALSAAQTEWTRGLRRLHKKLITGSVPPTPTTADVPPEKGISTMKVFWSWQSDTPGKTGRHFVRDALAAAIEELKTAEDVAEPSEREAKEALHLDQDRQGVSGSPDLAPLILKKIAVSTVFVADVTPVSKIPGRGRGKDRIPEKRIMNPNVAIELGFALAALTDENVLMVCNSHYGGRQHLPFDLAHKAGPLFYDLPPGADAATIKREAAKLKGQFVTGLRSFLKQQPAPTVSARRQATTFTASALSRA